MDLLIAANTVTQENADTAPVSGSPGWATDGDPAKGIPATDAPAWHYNMITGELIAIIKAAGFTPSNSDWSQVIKALQTIFSPAQYGVAPFSKSLAQLIGGYPLNAVVADPTTPGTFWVSTADANASTPGADGAAWKSLFNGYATQDWADLRYLILSSTSTQIVTGPVVFSGSQGKNAQITNAPASPATGIGGDVPNTRWVDQYYARATALAAEAQARASADTALNNFKANLAGGNTFTNGDQVVTGTNVAGNFSNSWQFVTKETTTGMSAGLKASRNLTTGDSFLALGFVDTGGNYHEHQFDYSGSIYSSTKNDSVAWKADLPVGTVTSTNTYSKVGSIITQTFFVVLPSITSGTGYTINLPTALATGIQGVNVTVGSDANCQLSTRDWTKGSFTLVPYLTSSQGTKFSITVTGD